MRGRAAILTLSAGLACVSVAVRASTLDRDLDTLVALLDSPDLASREAALQRLRLRSDVSVSTIEAMLRERRDLSAEQRARLYALARAMFDDGPRAGMGIQFGSLMPDGVQVAATVAGFDAARVLRPQDILHRVEGRRIASTEQMRHEILSREPGETMALTIIRDGRQREVSLVMGSYADLNRGRSIPIEPGALDQAWRTRLDRIGMENPLHARQAGAFDGQPARPSPGEAVSWQARAISDIEIREGSLEAWLVHQTPGVLGAGESRGGIDRFGRPRTRIGPFDAVLPASGDVARVLERDDAELRLAFLLDSLQASQRRIDRARNENTRRLARAESSQERDALLAVNERLTRASRSLSRWIREWYELADSGRLNGG